MDVSDIFSTETDGLVEAAPPEEVRLEDGDRYGLTISAVSKHLGDSVLRMLAYNGSIPGPTLRVNQGSEITIDVVNVGDIETTVHWHGLRLENRFDGVPGETQTPISIGGRYTQRVKFPDAGFYWYHPHIREDFAQEMGLYGTIVVDPWDADYWPPVDRELTITLDDLLIEDGRIAPFFRSHPTFVAMGRFGNAMLINGDSEFLATASVGEVVRLYLVNTANTRVFNVGLPGARMKLVGGDSGRCERESFVETVMLAPSERVIVDVLFEQHGEVRLEHRTPERVYKLGRFLVDGDPVSTRSVRFEDLRIDPELATERRFLESIVDKPPDKVLAFQASMPLLYDVGNSNAASYVCPMHPEVVSSEPGKCPKCGMKLIPADAPAGPSHEHMHSATGGDLDDGIEWEDLMPDINRRSDPTNMIWKLIDRETGAENGAISWHFHVDDKVKIRLVNEMESDHPMHHPFHIHGAGRFLVQARDGQLEQNLAWKDTVLIKPGETMDIILYVTNPGLWMAHCHIAEHLQGGMMFSFEVSP